MPTGTGKTFLAALWFKNKLKKNKDAKLLFICHNKDILSQANEREFQKCLKGLKIKYGYYIGKTKEIKQATFATTQTLTRNLKKFKKNQFDYIIVDEAHHYQANSFKKVVCFFKPKFLLGLTATPNRMDKKDIYSICGKKIYELKIYDAIKSKLLSKFKYYCVDNDIDFSKIKWNGNNYDEKDLNKKICIKEYDEAIIKEYKKDMKRFGTKKTICFCATVEHAYRMERKFNEAGIKAVALTAKYKKGKTEISLSDYKRNKIINGFRQGNYKIIFVRDMFNEGIDIPDADCVMMLRPTLSSTIFTQQVGRGLRISPNKKHLLILDFIGNSKRCQLNFEVLESMMNNKLVDDIKKQDTKKYDNKKKICFFSNGCEVILNKKKVDILQNNLPKNITKEHLINHYFYLKKSLNRQPTLKDLNNSKYGSHLYYSYFGNYNNFLELMNEIPRHNSKITKEDLIDNYFELKKKLGRQPLVMEINKKKGSKYCKDTYVNFFGSWNKFTKEIGEPSFKNTNKQVTKKELIEYYFNLKNKLKRQPIQRDFVGTEYSFHQYDKKFGSFKKFLKEIDEPVKRNLKEITKEEIIKKYYELKKNLGRKPILRDFKGQYSYQLFNKFWSSYNNFLEAINEPRTNHNRIITNEDLIKQFYEVKKKLGRKPILRDFKGTKYGETFYLKRFGSWNKFLKRINEPHTNHSENVSKEDLINNYFELKEKLHRQLNVADIHRNKGSKYNITYYLKYFKNWNNFLEQINEIPKHPTKITKKDLIDNYYEVKKRLGKRPSYDDMTKQNGKFCARTYGVFFKSWSDFLKSIKEPSIINVTKEELITHYYKLKEKLGRQPKTKDLMGNGYSLTCYSAHFGSWNNFLKIIGEPKSVNKGNFKYKHKYDCNVKIICRYMPVNKIVSQKSNFIKRINKGQKINGLGKYEFHSSIEKANIRDKIISKINDGDVVLLLESAELAAIKEIEKQGKNPSKIIIPNHQEFDKVAKELKKYKTSLNIELINTSALQYINDTEIHFDFIWLDYYGAFTSYTRDLDLILSKQQNYTLVLTYNIYDPMKQDDSYYFTKVIAYVLNKINHGQKVNLLEDISYKYKKTMYNIGFNISKMET